MILSYTADEIRELYREAKYKDSIVEILKDLNPAATIDEIMECIGVQSVPKRRKVGRPKSQPLKNPFENRQIKRAIKNSVFPTLYAEILRKYGSVTKMCESCNIFRTSARRVLQYGKINNVACDVMLESVGLTIEEARQEWNPCTGKDTERA